LGTKLEKQTLEFLVHLDALVEGLRPKRRPQDRDEPECSAQELRVLTAVGQRDTLTMSDLAGMLRVPQSTATHTVDRLVAKGLVERRRASEDRRVVQITFSRRGRRINQFVAASRMAAGRRLLQALKPRDREMLIQWMASLARAPHRYH
jgi:DNA-binding MarR family transcriptional regulator